MLLCCLLCPLQVVGAACPDAYWDVVLKGVPGVTAADCQRTGQGSMPSEQQAAMYALRSLGEHLREHDVLLGRLNWNNFGQAAPTAEAELMLAGSLQPLKVRFHLYVPEDTDRLVIRTRTEMMQVSANRHSWPPLHLMKHPTGQERSSGHCLEHGAVKCAA